MRKMSSQESSKQAMEGDILALCSKEWNDSFRKWFLASKLGLHTKTFNCVSATKRGPCVQCVQYLFTKIESSLVSKSMFLVECVDVEFEVWAGLWKQRVTNQNLNKIKLNQWLHVDSNVYTIKKTRSKTVWLKCFIDTQKSKDFQQ